MIFVDDYRGRYGRMLMSHLTTIPFDAIELHVFAQSIGLKPAWFQGDHFDVCQSKRKEAIELGALPVSARVLSKAIHKLKAASAWPKRGGVGMTEPQRGERVRWQYRHCMGTTTTQIVKVGTYLGKCRHTRKHWQKPWAKQLAWVQFNGNKSISRVPFVELDFSTGGSGGFPPT